MTKKHLNTIALIILLLGQTILGPIGATRAFAEGESSGTGVENGGEGNQGGSSEIIVPPPVTTTSPDTITITPPPNFTTFGGDRCYDSYSMGLMDNLEDDQLNAVQAFGEVETFGNGNCGNPSNGTVTVYKQGPNDENPYPSPVTINLEKHGHYDWSDTASADEPANFTNVHNGDHHVSEVFTEGQFCGLYEGQGKTGEELTEDVELSDNGFKAAYKFEVNNGNNAPPNKHYIFTFVNAPEGVDCDGNPTNTTGSGTVTVKKIDQNGNPVKGFKFKLTGPNYSKILTTGNNGVATQTDVPFISGQQEYKLSEMDDDDQPNAWDDYKYCKDDPRNDTPNSKYRKFSLSESDSVKNFQFVNAKKNSHCKTAAPGKIKIIKKGPDGHKLPGMVFDLYKEDGTYVGTETSDVANGYVKFTTGVYVGMTYKVKEQASSLYEVTTDADGYVIPDGAQTSDIMVTSKDDWKKVTVTNRLKSKPTAELTVTKTFQDSNNDSLSAIFKLTGVNISYDSGNIPIINGESYTFEGLKEGKYKLTEESQNSDDHSKSAAGPWYFEVDEDGNISGETCEVAVVPSMQTYTHTPPITPGVSTCTVSIENPLIPTAELTVGKTFQDSNDDSLSAIFKLTGVNISYDSGNKPIINGESYTFEGLKKGKYKLTEESQNSDDHSKSATGPWYFEVDEDGNISGETCEVAVVPSMQTYTHTPPITPGVSTCTVSIVNPLIPTASLEVIKEYEGEENVDWEAMFTLKGPSNLQSPENLDKLIGENGYTFTNLKPGIYTLVETDSGSPNHKTASSLTFEVDDEGQIWKVISKPNEEPTKEQVTEPIPVTNPLIQTAQLKINKTFKYPFYPENATAEDYLKATFTLVGPEGNNSQTQTRIFTDITDTADGVIFENLKPGKYTLTEAALANYKTMTPIEFTVNEDGTIDNTGLKEKVLSITNEKETGALFIWKTDPDKQQWWDITRYLSGAKFKLVDSDGNEYGGTQTTVVGGALFKDIPYGTYKLIETQAPNGYDINPDYDEAVTGGKTITIPSQTGVNIPSFILDFSGWSNLADMQNVGLEEVSNTKTPKGSVTLTKHNDEVLPEGIERKTLPNAVFKLYQVVGEIDSEEGPKDDIEINADKELKTGSDGKITVGDLSIGNYYFVETDAPYGYEKDGTPISFEITAENYKVGVQVDAYNTTLTGSQTLFKWVSEEGAEIGLNGAEFSVFPVVDGAAEAVYEGLKTQSIDGEDGYLVVEGLPYGEYYFQETKAPDGYMTVDTPIYFTIDGNIENDVTSEFENHLAIGSVTFTKVDDSEEPKLLTGAVFELRYKAPGESEFGEAFGDYTSDTNVFVIDNLAGGDYQLIEKKAPKYHVLNTTPILFSIGEGEEQQVNVELPPIVNEKGGDIIVEKVDAADHAIKLSEVVFELRDGDEVVATATSGEDGIARFEGVPYGSYTIHEVTPHDGYLLSDAVISVALEEGIDELRLDNPIENQKIHESFTVRKVSATDPEGPGLPNAVFKVQAQVQSDSPDGLITEYVDVPGMGNLVTNAAGVIPETELAPGIYQLVEMIAPAGYSVNSTPTPFTIVENQTEVVSLTVVNSLLPTPPGPGPETGGGGGGGGETPPATIVPPTPQPQTPFVVVPPAPGVPVTVGEEPQPEGPNVTVEEEPQPEGPSVTVEEEPQPEGPSVTVEEEPQPEGPSVTVSEQPRPQAPRPTLPRTGEGVPVGVLTAGLALTLLGGWLLFGRRRKEDSQL